jgi:hypothetical protein
MQVVQYLLDIAGIGGERLVLKWVSAAEGQLFAGYVDEITEKIRQIGPFDPAKFELPLAAAASALYSPKLRWLIGMEAPLTEKENVYKEKIDADQYQHLLKKATQDEYEGALILEVLKSGAQSVRQIALKTGLPVYTVSMRLGELERCHQAKFHGYDGNVALFSSLTAEAQASQ